jgi:pSer/pThr/pTyr-binding forkhead associated (FHA) protein
MLSQDQPAIIKAPPSALPACLSQPNVPLRELARAGLALAETDYLTIGGGLGSFVWADHLRVYGARAGQVRALGPEPAPYAQFARLCRNSQIPPHERLRSNSDACPDNLWGWPGYAVREAWSYLRRGDLSNAAAVLWQVFGEPTFAETYTPRAGAVYAAIEREAARIGWADIWRPGYAHALRKTDDGGYVVAYSQSGRAGAPIDRLIVARHVHIAVGHADIRVLPDVQEYRARTGDHTHVVNAYEAHDQVYAHLRRLGGTVVVRGRGIVASRVVQLLGEARAHNDDITVLHLLQSPIIAGRRYANVQRRAAHHWEFQVFNWPKACWGGEFRALLERSDEAERARLLRAWGGTTTAERAEWAAVVDRGVREGWYQIRFGAIGQMQPNPDGTLTILVRGHGGLRERTALCADFVIDCTGLEENLEDRPLLSDLVAHYQLERNPYGRLKVDSTFEIAGMANGGGRAYASGTPIFGGSFAPVDSFLGLQYAAWRSVEALVAQGAPGLRPLNAPRSARQWLAWARGRAP